MPDIANKAYKQITPARLRSWVQFLFFTWVLYLGIQFGRFVLHFTSQGRTPFVERPPGVDGFLPIGALASLKYWLLTGQVSPFHPAALILLVTFLTMALLARKSFCSWLCPVGTLSEWLWKGGKRLFGQNFSIWTWIDLPLRGIKYLLLLFFGKLILLDMPVQGLAFFLKSPYWAMSDVKMLKFFTYPSATSLCVVGGLVVLSLLYKNFWCRYLCPYGALLGLLSSVSPFKIRRDEQTCVNCRKCSEACPSRLPVASCKAIHSPECTGCLSCTAVCPVTAVKMLPPPIFKLHQCWPQWGFPILVLALYASGVAIGMISGHWHSSLTYADYQQLIPHLDQLGF